jgi:putative hydrolase of the HAD superfamily
VRSHELGLAKPDPAIFAHADAVLPPGAGQALLIDDSADNCAAARRWGWQSIQHSDPGRTIGILQRMFPVNLTP